ncbi:hypothetical protein [Pseudoalteromonas sp. Of7M-16]|uniref:hypothetical protein n=1 Tax=Pseudoalteromonas sp. Of7M-16 TaxID=2917756 RepID=UPI001EF73041|nr:hypothetical protein [Pseudoalteromonas sp. Of7M-16]MCG7549044.1 hypothetical protein [Pseudoalteromonas sp. Of7M-16]
MKEIKLSLALSVSLVLLTSCGGGGGGNDSSVSTPPTPVHGVCGSANKTYSYTDFEFGSADNFCASGDEHNKPSSFPASGSNVSWECKGQNGGTTASCQASRLKIELSEDNKKSFINASVNVGENGVSNASIDIFTLDKSQLIYTTSTDEAGNFKISQTFINDKFDSQEIDYILVKSSFGSAGSSSPVDMPSEIYGVIPKEVILDSEEFSVNLITSSVYEIAKMGTVENRIMSYISNRLFPVDVNEDGFIDYADAYSPKLKEQESEFKGDRYKRIATALKSEGSNDNNDLIATLDIVPIKYTVSDGNFTITLNKGKKDIFYTTNSMFDINSAKKYENELKLSNGSYFTYAQCSDDKQCGSKQVISTNGDRLLYHNHLEVASNSQIDITYMNELRGIIHEKHKTYTDAQSSKKDTEAELDSLLQDAESLKSSVAEIESEAEEDL